MIFYPYRNLPSFIRFFHPGKFLRNSETVYRPAGRFPRPLIPTVLALTLMAHPFSLFAQEISEASKLLAPVKTDSPRDTMVSFISSMNRYREESYKNTGNGDRYIQDAVRTLDLSEVSPVLRFTTGSQAAIFLKEVIDRTIIIDPQMIPGSLHDDDAPPPDRWRLKGTEILIRRIEEGERKGEYLFSADTVERSRQFYERVRELPFLEGSGNGALYEAPWMEKNLPSWAKDTFLGIFWWQWLGLFGIILSGLVLRTVVRYTLEVLAYLARKTKYSVDEQLAILGKGPIDLFAAGFFWLIAIRFLRLEGDILAFFNLSVRGIISVSLIWAAYRVSTFVTTYFQSMAEKTESTLDDHLVPLLNRTIRIFTVIIGTLVAIQNLGVNVISLLTGLGIGGIAFALAAKDTVANFFGSIMILFDSPFQVGDWVILGAAEGTVEEIGFRSTRIRTFYDSLITIPNSDLMNARIDNMGRREYRRIRTVLGIRYDTSPERIEAFLEAIKSAILANPVTRKDYFHVVFSGFGAHSLDILVYCFLKVPDWANELVERQNLYLEFIRIAKELKVEFAYPTSTVLVEEFPEKKPVRDLPEEETESEFREKARSFGPEGERSRPGGAGVFTPPYRE